MPPAPGPARGVVSDEAASPCIPAEPSRPMPGLAGGLGPEISPPDIKKLKIEKKKIVFKICILHSTLNMIIFFLLRLNQLFP